MTHIPESEFVDDYALPWLRDRFPHADFEREKWVGKTGGYVDAWVRIPDEDPAVILAVEVGAVDSVREDAAQALEYADNDDRAVPYVIIPDDHAKDAVVDLFRKRGVVIVELETDTEP